MKAATAPTPPMGWNSWDCFGVDVTEAEVKANAAVMADQLLAFGWNHVVVDLGWYGDGLSAIGEQYKMLNPPMVIDDWGRVIPNPALHPSSAGGAGFKPLADHLHTQGLKLGIHIMRGVPWNAVRDRCPIEGTSYTCADIAIDDERCPWFHGFLSVDMTHPGGQAWYDSLARLYAQWEVDFIKADDMNSWTGAPTSPYRADEVEGLASALSRCGRDITLSLSPGSAHLGQAAHLARHAHMWRISPDLWDDWASVRRMFDHCRRWAPLARSGAWPDADMLPLGRLGVRAEVGAPRNSRLSTDEARTMLSLWAIARSPLMFGGHLPETDPATLALLRTPEVIALNQNGCNPRECYRDDARIVWETRIGTERAFGFFNVSEAATTFADLGGPLALSPDSFAADLWSGSFSVPMAAMLGQSVAPHAVCLFTTC